MAPFLFALEEGGKRMIQQIIGKIIAHKAGIALGGAMVGVAVTAIVAAKDSRKHEQEITDFMIDQIEEAETEEERYNLYELDAIEYYKEHKTKKERAIIFTKSYWRTGMAMAVTFALMIFSHRSMAKEIAATTAALGVVSAKYKELDAALKEKYPDVHEKVHKLIDERNIRKKLSDKTIKEESYDGRNRYYEEFSQQVFFATEAQIKEAECELNERLINTGECNLFTYLATFPKSSGVKLEDWMKHVGWYEGDTTYSYNSGYFGMYVKPEVVNEPIIYNGEKINVNKIRWNHLIDYDPELDNNEIACIEAALEGIA